MFFFLCSIKYIIMIGFVVNIWFIFTLSLVIIWILGTIFLWILHFRTKTKTPNLKEKDQKIKNITSAIIIGYTIVFIILGIFRYRAFQNSYIDIINIYFIIRTILFFIAIAFLSIYCFIPKLGWLITHTVITLIILIIRIVFLTTPTTTTRKFSLFHPGTEGDEEMKFQEMYLRPMQLASVSTFTCNRNTKNCFPLCFLVWSPFDEKNKPLLNRENKISIFDIPKNTYPPIKFDVCCCGKYLNMETAHKADQSALAINTDILKLQTYYCGTWWCRGNHAKLYCDLSVQHPKVTELIDYIGELENMDGKNLAPKIYRLTRKDFIKIIRN